MPCYTIFVSIIGYLQMTGKLRSDCIARRHQSRTMMPCSRLSCRLWAIIVSETAELTLERNSACCVA